MPTSSATMSRFRRVLRRSPRWLLGILVILLLVRLALPWVGLFVINDALEKKLGNYRGSIEDFDLTLYRGAYQLQGLVIRKRDETAKLPPLLQSGEVDLSLAWRALFRGELSADITLRKPALRLLDSGDEKKQQLGTDEPTSNWQAAFDVVVPMKVEALEIHDGSVHFVNRGLGNPLPVQLDQLELSARDLRSRDRENLSPFRARARLQSHAKLEVDGAISVLAEQRAMDLNFQIEKFRIESINDNLREYVPIDVTKGELSLYGEVAYAKGEGTGYAKVFLHEADIIAPRQKFFSVKHFLLEIVGAFGNWLLKNGTTRNVAFTLPYEYRGGKLNWDTSEAFWSSIRNISVGLTPGIEHSVSLASLKPMVTKDSSAPRVSSGPPKKKEATPKAKAKAKPNPLKAP